MTSSKGEHNEGKHFVYPDPQFISRSSAASALRRLGNIFVRYRGTEDQLNSITEWANSSANSLQQSQSVPRPSDYFKRRYSDPRPPDGSEVIAFSDRTFSGPANPMGAEVLIRRDGDEVIGRVVFGAAFESAPGRVHGGAVSALVDDTMGYLMIVLGEAAYTARLEVDYRGGVPVDTPVWFRAWEQERDGRKITVSLIVTQDSGEKAEPLITAKGLFIIPPKDDD